MARIGRQRALALTWSTMSGGLRSTYERLARVSPPSRCRVIKASRLQFILTGDRVKFLVISFPCVTAVNQSFYSDLEEQTGWQSRWLCLTAGRRNTGQSMACAMARIQGNHIIAFPYSYPAIFPGTFIEAGL